MRFIVKFGKEVIQGIDFPDTRTARAWAVTCFQNRHVCGVTQKRDC